MKPLHNPCFCKRTCGDIPEDDDPWGICKGLPRAPEPPLVRIVLVPRADALSRGEGSRG